jgi:cytochrome c oxidase assembly protein subunit 15
MSTSRVQNAYLLWLKMTILAVGLLILVGGIVRATGSGLGCPDWPQCFGQWVPPTDVSELPSDYKTRFQVAGKEIADFDAFKTWTEYLNRLLGAFIGLFILVTAILAGPFKKERPSLFWGSWGAFVLVGFQGWVGAVVVQTYLAGYMITIHMFLALCLVYLLFWLYRQGQDHILHKQQSQWGHLWQTKSLILILFIFSLIQVMIGTQVREAINHVIQVYPDLPREIWVERSGATFLIHRSFSILIVLAQVGLCLKLWRLQFYKDAKIQSLFLLLTLGTGIGLGYLGFPKVLQPLHLVFALGLNALHFDLLLRKHMGKF